jgi:serine/threonine protein kinase
MQPKPGGFRGGPGYHRGRRIIRDKYEVTGILGKGGMGVVLAALHRELGEPVAIKFPRPGLRGEP